MKAEWYRELAAECARLAKRAIDDRAKTMFHEMGEAWVQLAEWAEKKKRKVAEMIGSEER
jgi:hypothetical protein